MAQSRTWTSFSGSVSTECLEQIVEHILTFSDFLFQSYVGLKAMTGAVAALASLAARMNVMEHLVWTCWTHEFGFCGGIAWWSMLTVKSLQYPWKIIEYSIPTHIPGDGCRNIGWQCSSSLGLKSLISMNLYILTDKTHGFPCVANIYRETMGAMSEQQLEEWMQWNVWFECSKRPMVE